MEYQFSGEVFIHAVARAATRQVEWMLAEILEYQVPLIWSPQPAVTGAMRTGFAWQGDESGGAVLTSALAGWREIHFEVTQDSALGVGASRWMYTPELGIKHRQVDEFGNYLVSEVELRSALTKGSNSVSLTWEIKHLLADQWEQALEPLRSLLISAPMAKIKQVS